MTGDHMLVANHLIANNINTRVNCDWRILASVKNAIDEHNAKADAYNQGDEDSIAEFELMQSAVTIAQTLNSLIDPECGDPLSEEPLFIAHYQGGTLVNIRYEIRNADEIAKWLEKSCEGKWSELANSVVDADILGNRKPIQNADIVVVHNRFDFQGATEWKGLPTMSVKFELEKDAEEFHTTWHV